MKSIRKKMILGNWKMHLSVSQAELLIHDMLVKVKSVPKDRLIGIAPSFSALSTVGLHLQSTDILLGAQNCSFKLPGAFTGEESITTLKELGVTFVIIGHSERRTLLGESDDIIHKKVMHVLKSGVHVVLCVGENQIERERGTHLSFVQNQLEKDLSGIAHIKNLAIAYEPIWAISSTKSHHTASPNEAEEMHAYIREYLSTEYGTSVAQETSILYGGSVDEENISKFLSQDNIDGALVGSASLDAEKMSRMFRM